MKMLNEISIPDFLHIHVYIFLSLVVEISAYMMQCIFCCCLQVNDSIKLVAIGSFTPKD